jgi:MipA family protein
MTKRKPITVLAVACVVACAGSPARALDIVPLDNAPPSVWIVGVGGYGVLEPTYEGSKSYNFGLKPQFEIRQTGDREWLMFPNDAVDFNVYETSNFHAGPAAELTLQSRFHGEDIDLRLGKADADLQGGLFAEYYPLSIVRTRAELLQGVTGNTGLALNLSADYIWYPQQDWTLTLGPRAQIVNDQYASDYFSTQFAKRTGTYVQYHADGGLLSAGAEMTGKYDLSREMSAKFFADFDQLAGDAADSPHVSIRGNSSQFIAGVGAAYKFAVQP